MRHGSDKRALEILFNAYWTSAGWKPEQARNPLPEDFAYAKKHGVMFDSLPLDHTAVLSRLSNAISKLTPRIVGDAFLASLTTRKLEWRSALGSYSVFRHLPEHESVGSKQCSFCGLYLQGNEDLNVLNFERHKWGGVRHSYPCYAMLDLELFIRESPPKPLTIDIAIFDQIVAAIDGAPAGTSSANLHKVFPRGMKGNKAERDAIVSMLGFCGALGTADHMGFSARFIPADCRPLPDRRFVDMAYPACWWTRAEGFDRSALREYFGHASNSV